MGTLILILFMLGLLFAAPLLFVLGQAFGEWLAGSKHDGWY